MASVGIKYNIQSGMDLHMSTRFIKHLHQIKRYVKTSINKSKDKYLNHKDKLDKYHKRYVPACKVSINHHC